MVVATVARATMLASHSVLADHIVLAKATVNSNDVTPGVLGFLVVAGMAIVLVFLLRSMNRQFRKLPPPPDPEAAEDPAAGAGKAGDPAARAEEAGTGVNGRGPARPTRRS
ncbi:MAG TPA: hypothetical protein VKV33_04085 [Streptosporangiaceae bacterium]|nr:hypothetical protein [Streptosporangiaceae bacterium]